MNITKSTDLTAASADQLGRIFGYYDAAACAAPAGSRASAIAQGRRELAGNEAFRRGLLIRRLSDGSFACGHARDFEPIR